MSSLILPQNIQSGFSHPKDRYTQYTIRYEYGRNEETYGTIEWRKYISTNKISRNSSYRTQRNCQCRSAQSISTMLQPPPWMRGCSTLCYPTSQQNMATPVASTLWGAMLCRQLIAPVSR